MSTPPLDPVLLRGLVLLPGPVAPMHPVLVLPALPLLLLPVPLLPVPLLPLPLLPVLPHPVLAVLLAQPLGLAWWGLGSRRAGRRM